MLSKGEGIEFHMDCGDSIRVWRICRSGDTRYYTEWGVQGRGTMRKSKSHNSGNAEKLEEDMNTHMGEKIGQGYKQLKTYTAK